MSPGHLNWPVDLRELRYFVGVAELKSFSKAATSLRIAQPALSRQVRKLEEQLGVELLTRHARGVELTEAGQILLDRAYAIFRQLEQTRDDVAAHAASPTGVITIGIPPAAGEFLIPTLVEKTRSTYPNITTRIIEGYSAFIYERLINHQLNLAILHNPIPHRELRIRPLLVEHMYVIGPPVPDPPEAYSLKDLARLPMILPHRPHSLRLLIEHTAAEHHLRPNIVFEVDGLGIVKAMVRRGLGYTTLTFGSVYHEVAEGVLHAAPITDPSISWTLATATRLDQSRSQAMVVMQRLVADVVRDLVAKGVWRGQIEYSPQQAGT